MWKQFRVAMLLLFWMSLLTGVAYPLLTCAVAEAFFAEKAHGSLVRRDGRIVGSRLIGRWYEEGRYFWPRPSATGPGPYNGASSSGSNLGPLHADLAKGRAARQAALWEVDKGNRRAAPADLLTASGSGLDPHISPAAAAYQAERVAKARGLRGEQVEALIAAATEGRQFGILGEARVNVLELNLSLDDLQ
ncbi:MAG: potassium-transporting ATPase subunit KdpC [Bryobacterales bacterium]|nr:potassium-transporting ATPase subunit KdpC [Bryobacterales bacterium]